MIPFDGSGSFCPIAKGRDLRRLAVRGAAVTVSAAWLSLALRVVPTVVLARLLTPADFGVMAMVTTFSLLLVSFGTSGFNEAIIQAKEMNRFRASNLFWITCAIGLMLTIGFAASGPLLARFFRSPLVAPVAAVTSLAIFISSASAIHSALLRRAMRFGVISLNDVVALAVYTATGILLALRGWGYWALVAATIAQALSTAMGAWWLCRWIPSLPRRGMETRPLLRFAANVYARFSANYFARNFDNVLVGWQFNAVALGFYKKAYDLFALSASQLTAPLHSVAIAALSRLNQEPARFRRYLINSLAVIAFVGMAAGADLTLVGKDVVRLVLGPGWEESGRIFTFFGPGIGLMLLTSTAGWIHLSIGRPDRWLRWSLFEFAVTALLFVIALRWGPQGIAVAWSASFIILTVPAFWYAGRPIQFGAASLLSAVWKYVVASLLSGCACAALISRFLPLASIPTAAVAFERILVISGLFVGLYLGAVISLHRGLAPIRQLASLVRELAPGERPARPVPEVTNLRAGAIGPSEKSSLTFREKADTPGQNARLCAERLHAPSSGRPPIDRGPIPSGAQPSRSSEAKQAWRSSEVKHPRKHPDSIESR
jgi:O-antigen/teichoic acid export membrane protein